MANTKLRGTKRCPWMKITTLPSKFTIVTNEDDWNHLMRVNKISDCAWEKENLGTCIALPIPVGHAVAVQLPKQEPAIFAILHESVHVWQKIIEYIGEDDPGIEQEAYTIEYIQKELMQHYQEITGELLWVPCRKSANKKPVSRPHAKVIPASPA